MVGWQVLAPHRTHPIVKGAKGREVTVRVPNSENASVWMSKNSEEVLMQTGVISFRFPQHVSGGREHDAWCFGFICGK